MSLTAMDPEDRSLLFGGEPDPEPRRDDEPEGVNPILFVHRLLRGRYQIAALLALVLAVICGLTGYLIKNPEFVSVGQIEVKAEVDPILESIPEANTRDVNAEVDSQRAILTSDRTLSAAANNKFLTDIDWPEGNRGVLALKQGLNVYVRPRSKIINVEFRHPDAGHAQRAVKAVIDEYEKLRDEADRVEVTTKLQTLTSRQIELATQQDTATRIARDIESRLNVGDISSFLERKNSELLALDDQIQSLEARRVLIPDPDNATDAASLDFLSEQYPVIAELRSRQISLRTELQRLSGSFGPRHPQILELQEQISLVDFEIEQWVKATALSPEDLESRLDFANGQRRALREQINELRASQADIVAQREKAQAAQTLWEETTRRIDRIRLELEGQTLNRVAIISRGSKPLEPDSDRRNLLAAAGVAFGFGTGFASVALFGFFTAGYRYLDDVKANHPKLPLLGVLPELDDGDIESDDIAALGIHHVRGLLESFAARTGDQADAIAITSPNAGDGKTSFSLSLAISFAVAGHKTLIIDTDMVGQGLTRELELGGTTGFADAVAESITKANYYSTRYGNLHAMPCGLTDTVNPERLSLHGVRRLLAELRPDFDTIVLDCGPVLGSLEATFACIASDRVVMVASRGGAKHVVDAAIEKLRMLGAAVSGIVFNRAMPMDFQTSISAVSVAQRSMQSKPALPAPGQIASQGVARRAGEIARRALQRGGTERIRRPSEEPGA